MKQPTSRATTNSYEVFHSWFELELCLKTSNGEDCFNSYGVNFVINSRFWPFSRKNLKNQSLFFVL